MRHLKHKPAADHLDDIIAAMPKPGVKRAHSPKQLFARYDSEMVAMRDSKDWSKAKGKHLVALYAWLHAEVYKVDPIELFDGQCLLGACSAANRLIEDVFGGDPERAVHQRRHS